MIACKTVIGKGAPNKAGSHKVHGAPLGAEEIAATRAALNWPHAAFEIPDEVRRSWLAIAERGKQKRMAWEASLQAHPQRDEFVRGQETASMVDLLPTMNDYKKKLSNEAPKIATRKASEMALDVLNDVIPNPLGGSADLTGSNNTKSHNMTSVTRDNYAGDYVHYGIREHGMAAAMNGVALHGGFFAYGGTFLAFADYNRPAIRLSALMGVPVAYVMTHDSIGLGEDGPTHQPVETVASLRAMPNLLVFRPADAVETAEAWMMSATSTCTPTLLCLTRQNVPLLRTTHVEENLVAKGAYVLREADGGRDVTLFASGSEVSIAMEASSMLAKAGVKAAVVSAPCFELFAQQDDAYQAMVRGTAPRVGVEAAIRQGWDLFLDRSDGFVGMKGFGASAPAADLYRHFGITAEAVANEAMAQLGREELA